MRRNYAQHYLSLDGSSGLVTGVALAKRAASAAAASSFFRLSSSSLSCSRRFNSFNSNCIEGNVENIKHYFCPRKASYYRVKRFSDTSLLFTHSSQSVQGTKPFFLRSCRFLESLVFLDQIFHLVNSVLQNILFAIYCLYFCTRSRGKEHL